MSLLGGRLHYRQPESGYRTGIEPVLLAASLAVRPGERVLEAGTGAGAALLCLAARLPGTACVGVERDSLLAALARENLDANGVAAEIVEADLLAFVPAGRFAHAIANPPWHDPAGPASPDPMRAAAKHAERGLLTAWVAALAACLAHQGSLTLILPAGHVPAALAALATAGCGSPELFPLWPRAGQPARLALVRGRKGGRGACRVLPGLVLHEGDGWSPAARAVLWDGTALQWD